MEPETMPPGAPAARRRPIRGGFPILLGAVAGVLLCAVAVAAGSLLGSHTPDPAPAARALCADLVAHDYAALYALLSPQQQAAGTQAQFVASQRQLDVLRGATTRCAAVVTAESGATAEATLTLTRAAAVPTTGQAQLVLTAGGWRVNSFDNSLVTRPLARTADPN